MHAMALLDQRVELLQDVGAILITLRIPLADQRQQSVIGIIPAGVQPAFRHMLRVVSRAIILAVVLANFALIAISRAIQQVHA